MNCCEETYEAGCSIGDILQRIEPIQYVNGTLIVNSPISVQEDININNNLLTLVGGTLDLPADSTIAGQPLNGPPFTGDTLELPQYTTINGFSIFTTNYFYFFNTSIGSIDKQSGNYIINSDYTTPSINNIRFPFFAPEDCVLTSFIFSFAVSTSGVSTITNVMGYIDVVDTLGNITYTGVSVVIPECPRGTKYYAEKYFQYTINKGHSVGVRFTYDGSAFSVCQFAVIGYKFIAPP